MALFRAHIEAAECKPAASCIWGAAPVVARLTLCWAVAVQARKTSKPPP